MNIEKEREAFEEAYSLAHKIYPSTLKKYADGSYYNGAVRAAWRWWQASALRAEAKLDGCVVVPKTELETCYYDEYEGMYLTNHDFLKNIDVGEAVEVKRQYYWETTPLFAAIVWDEDNQQSGTYELFETEKEAEKAAAHCKAMVEAARSGK